jgi:hypothetical protein
MIDSCVDLVSFGAHVVAIQLTNLLGEGIDFGMLPKVIQRMNPNLS